MNRITFVKKEFRRHTGCQENSQRNSGNSLKLTSR
jgi:hypothetical protein